jgi:hypothetical protein
VRRQRDYILPHRHTWSAHCPVVESCHVKEVAFAASAKNALSHDASVCLMEQPQAGSDGSFFEQPLALFWPSKTCRKIENSGVRTPRGDEH